MNKFEKAKKILEAADYTVTPKKEFCGKCDAVIDKDEKFIRRELKCQYCEKTKRREWFINKLKISSELLEDNMLMFPIDFDDDNVMCIKLSYPTFYMDLETKRPFTDTVYVRLIEFENLIKIPFELNIVEGSYAIYTSKKRKEKNR